MEKFIILTDTRQQKEKNIIKAFDNLGILHIKTKLDSADYMAVRYDSEKGFYKDYSILIDTKKDLLELCGNLCNSIEHARILREIELARKLGNKDFIFLIADNKIKNSEDIKKWSSKYTKVKGTTLFKIMSTMHKKYGIRFIIVPKNKMGETVVKLLTCKK